MQNLNLNIIQQQKQLNSHKLELTTNILVAKSWDGNKQPLKVYYDLDQQKFSDHGFCAGIIIDDAPSPEDAPKTAKLNDYLRGITDSPCDADVQIEQNSTITTTVNHTKSITRAFFDLVTFLSQFPSNYLNDDEAEYVLNDNEDQY